MSSDSADKSYLEAGIPVLGDYLLSKELFWPISARGYSLPRLTIGGILLAQARLEARREPVPSLSNQLDGIRSKWRVAWDTKAIREFQSRMRLWSNFLADYRNDPENHGDTYQYEVRTRVMLGLLLDEIPQEEIGVESFNQLDETLRALLISSDFIWNADLESGFPREQFWYLYGRLRS